MDYRNISFLPGLNNPQIFRKIFPILITSLFLILSACNVNADNKSDGQLHSEGNLAVENVDEDIQSNLTEQIEQLAVQSESLEPEVLLQDNLVEPADNLEGAFEAYSAKVQANKSFEDDQEMLPEASGVLNDDVASSSGDQDQDDFPPAIVEPANQPPEKPEPGFTAPDFNLTTLDGKQVNMAAFRGKPLIINYWATWCIPCMEELPVFEKISQEFPGIEVVSINGIDQDNIDVVKRTITDLRLTHLVLLDQGEQFWKKYLVMFLPTSFFVDRYGVIRHVQFGSLSEEKIREKINQLNAN